MREEVKKEGREAGRKDGTPTNTTVMEMDMDRRDDDISRRMQCESYTTTLYCSVLFCPATLHSEARWHQRANDLIFQFHHELLRIRATGAAWGSFA